MLAIGTAWWAHRRMNQQPSTFKTRRDAKHRKSAFQPSESEKEEETEEDEPKESHDQAETESVSDP